MTRVATIFALCGAMMFLFSGTHRSGTAQKPDVYSERIPGGSAVIEMIGVPGGTFGLRRAWRRGAV